MSSKVGTVLRQVLGPGEGLQVRRIIVERVSVLVMDEVAVRERTVRGLPIDHRPQSPHVRLSHLDPSPYDATVAAKANSADWAPVLRPVPEGEFGRGSYAHPSCYRTESHVGRRAAGDRAVVNVAKFRRLALERCAANRTLALNGGALAAHLALDDDRVPVIASRRAEHQTASRTPDSIGLYVNFYAAGTAGSLHNSKYICGSGTSALVARSKPPPVVNGQLDMFEEVS